MNRPSPPRDDLSSNDSPCPRLRSLRRLPRVMILLETLTASFGQWWTAFNRYVGRKIVRSSLATTSNSFDYTRPSPFPTGSTFQEPIVLSGATPMIHSNGSTSLSVGSIVASSISDTSTSTCSTNTPPLAAYILSADDDFRDLFFQPSHSIRSNACNYNGSYDPWSLPFPTFPVTRSPAIPTNKRRKRMLAPTTLQAIVERNSLDV